jgi:hypothetical protein
MTVPVTMMTVRLHEVMTGWPNHDRINDAVLTKSICSLVHISDDRISDDWMALLVTTMSVMPHP